jgi:hypothetical protein
VVLMLVYYTKEGRFEAREVPTNTILHREDGPALEADGSKYWFNEGRMHRTDGPAVIGADGSSHHWINNKYLSLEKFLEQTGWTTTQKVFYRLKL